ncbi:hypothetical protein ACXET9_02615 [Brachybacterium sp. DNPG3]
MTPTADLGRDRRRTPGADARRALRPDVRGVLRSDVRRALRLDLLLHRPLLLGTGAIALAVLALAAVQMQKAGIVVLLLATALPVGAAARDVPSEAALRGALGVSRAAHVLARTRWILAAQLAMMLIVLLVLLLGPMDDGAGMVTIGERLADPALWEDVLRWSGGVLLSHLWCGRDALRRTSGNMLWMSALGGYGIGYGSIMVLQYGAFLAAVYGGALLDRLGWWDRGSGLAPDMLEAGLSIGLGVVGIAVILLLLRRRSRVWAATA